MTLIYHCPLCQAPLNKTGNSMSCENRHQFDFAKEGYVNLLPVQNKKSKQPGDNLDMVQARRAFFATDHYHFLRQEIANLISLSSPQTLLDLGCGEGFYTHLFANELPECDVYGLDISKSAVKYAAKRYKEANFSVASAKQAPFANESMDCIVTVFAPVFEQELRRLVKCTGKVILVNPGPRHLFELKSLIYPEVNLHTHPDTPAGFELVKHHELKKEVEIKTEIIEHLIQMTPFAWKFKESHYDALGEKQSHSITLSFYLSEYQKV